MSARAEARQAGAWRVVLLAAALALAAITLTIAAGTLAGDVTTSPVVVLLAWVAGFIAAEWTVTHLEVRGHVISHSVVEVVTGIALLVASPATLVVARTVASSAVQLRRRREPIRLLFNGAMFASEAAVVATTFHLLTAGTDPLGPAGWVAGVVALQVGLVANGLSLAAVLRVTGTTSALRAVRGQVLALAPFTFALAVVGTLAAQLVARDERAAALGVLVAVVMWRLLVTMGGYVRRLRTLDAFHEHTARLQAARSVEEVTGVAVDALHALTGATWAEVTAPGTDGPVASHRGRIGGIERVSLDVPALRDVAEPRALLRAEHAARESTHGLVVPVVREGRGVGYVAAGFGPHVEQLRETEQVLTTVSRQVEAALLRVELAEELRAEEAARAHRALHDEASGLPNRANLVQAVDRGIAGGAHGAVVIALGLSRLHDVIDTLGDEVGELVVAESVVRLAASLEADSDIARIGRDTLAVHVRGRAPGGPLAEARRLRAALAPVHDLGDGLRLDVGAHVGVATAPLHGDRGDTLVRAAEHALQRAADAPTNIAEPIGHDDDARRRLTLAADLRLAVQGPRLSAWYQPKLDLRTGRVVSVEALARWEHAVHGWISPGEFIPIAEHSGAIVALTERVLDQVCHDLGTLRAMGHQLTAAVNLSSRVLAGSAAPTTIARLLHTHDVDPAHLTLELTESLFADGEAQVAIRDLRALGVALSIDDFGTGFSSLGYLHRFRADELKIDRSFLVDLEDDGARRAIVGSTIRLAHALGMTVVAEGVETRTVLRELRAMGCDVVQGYLVARPMPLSDLVSWLTALDDGRWAAAA